MKAIFFDAGGVLYRRERHFRHLRAFLQRTGLPAPTASELHRIKKEAGRRVPATASRSERYDALLAALGGGHLSPMLLAEGRAVIAEEAAEITLYPSVVETLRGLKAAGFKLGVITNTATPGTEKRGWLQSRGVDVPWDSFVSSCEVGVAKPHPRIYEIALDECAVRASDAVFVGHDGAELTGARTVGMKTVGFACGPDAAADDFIAELTDLQELAYLKRAA